MSDQPTTLWDVQQIHAEAAAIAAAIEAAHTGTDPCCCACDACQALQRFQARMMPRFAQQCADTERTATRASRKAEAARRKVKELNQWGAALLADYQALQEGHTALLADFDNLHAAYVMALEALSRARGQRPEIH